MAISQHVLVYLLLQFCDSVWLSSVNTQNNYDTKIIVDLSLLIMILETTYALNYPR